MDRGQSQGFGVNAWTLANRIQGLVTLAVWVVAIIVGLWWLVFVTGFVTLLVTRFVTSSQHAWWDDDVRAFFRDPARFKAWRRRELVFYATSFAVALGAIVAGVILVNSAA